MVMLIRHYYVILIVALVRRHELSAHAQLQLYCTRTLSLQFVLTTCTVSALRLCGSVAGSRRAHVIRVERKCGYCGVLVCPTVSVWCPNRGPGRVGFICHTADDRTATPTA